MNEPPVKPATVDAYIAGFPPDIQEILRTLQATVRKALPEADEKISYGMPAFAQHGMVIYYAAFKKHIGIFPPVKGDAQLQKDIARYRGEKGNLQLPLSEPIPYDLIARIAAARLHENLERKAAKKR
ncbi:MAG: DUF1801 domain-containing protein [Rhodothermales bacterium]|nr:DUF1801 domain-containing protein [Rhodothermales bacterium]